MQKAGGLDVHVATSVRSAMEMLSQAHYDVIVSDYQMPDTNGIEFLKMVRGGGSDTPFILFTGKGREDVVIDALNQGADYYLQKGGDLRSQFHELVSMMAQAVEGRRASNQLVESQERFRGLANSISDSLVGLDDDFRVTFWNRAATEVIEIKPEDAIGRNAFDLVPQIKGTAIENELRGAAESRERRTAVFDIELRGESKSFGIGIYPGEEGLLVFARDITATREAAQKLAESEERYKALVETSPDAIIVFAIDRILYANPAAVEVYGGDDDSDLVGKRIFDLIPPEYATETADRIRRMYKTAVSPSSRVMKVLTKSGHTLDMEVRSTPITFSGKKAIQTILRDVTERTKLEDALDKNVRELSIRNTIANIFLTVPGEEMYAEVLSAVLEATGSRYGLFGYIDENGDFAVPTMTPTVWSGHLTQGTTVVYQRETWGEGGWSEAIRQKQAVIRNHPSTEDPQGDIETTRHISMPMVHAGDVVGLIQVADKNSDYTDDDAQFLKAICDAIAPMLVARLGNVRQDAALRKAEEAASRVRVQLEHLLSESSAVTYSCDVEEPFGATYISPNVERLYGYQPEDFYKDSGFWASRIHPDDRDRVLREMQEIFEKGYHIHEYRWKRRDGTYAWMHDEVSLIRNEAGVPTQMVGLWLDITDRKKAEAEREMERRDFSLILDSSPIIVFYKDEEGKFLRVNSSFAKALEMPEKDFIGKTVFDIYSPDIAQGMTDDDQEVLRSGRPKHGIIERYESADGIRWVQTEKMPVKDEAGNVTGLIGFAQDITELKMAEEALKKVNRKLNLLGSITRHDSLNQIGILKGWLTAAIEQESDDSVRDLLHRIGNAADSLKMHLDFTSQYKSLGMKRPLWMSLAEIVSKVTEGLGRQDISVSVAVEDIEVYSDPMLENVFRNLINNSITHGGDVDSISISHRVGKDGLVIIYEDNGVGIPIEGKEKMFERGHGKRHGYGLYLSREILSMSGMTIKETGVPKKGARFEITVPPDNYRRKDGRSVTP
jgi:PAS domain S-box-containing protein